MKLSYSTLAAALFSTLSVSAFAGDVSIYGKANLTVQSSDSEDGSFTEVKSNASRIGFEGGQALDNDLELLFKAEFQVDLDGDSNCLKRERQQSNFGGDAYGIKKNTGEAARRCIFFFSKKGICSGASPRLFFLQRRVASPYFPLFSSKHMGVFP